MAQVETQGKLRVLSEDDKPFSNRVIAAKFLAKELEIYKDTQPVVLGIPRGGIIIANEIALNLDANLDIILTHKLGAPYNSELAIGAVSEDGRHFIVNDIAFGTRADNTYIEQEKGWQMQELQRKVKLYRAVLPKLPLADRTVIVTDDGVATGSTMQAAIWSIWREKPKKVVLALPVGPPDTVLCLSKGVDETICLKTPHDFQALGRFYQDFPQIEDEQLLKILQEEQKRRPRLARNSGKNPK